MSKPKKGPKKSDDEKPKKEEKEEVEEIEEDTSVELLPEDYAGGCDLADTMRTGG